MSIHQQLANQFRDLFLSGQWIGSNLNLKAQIDDLSVEEANTKFQSFNTIAQLVFHINYYLEGVMNVFNSGNLDIKDKYSFDMTPISTQSEWQTMKDNVFRNAEYFSKLIEKMPESQLSDSFTDEKYGTYFKNLVGMLEHSYYHLGQIVLIKKLIRPSI
ncbi:MAG: DinB family protein [Saprospiraceae bacterium]